MALRRLGLAFGGLGARVAHRLVRRLVAEVAVQRRGNIARIGATAINTPMPDGRNVRNSSAPIAALPPNARPIQPNLPNRSDACCGSLRLSRGTAVTSSVLSMK